MPTFKGISISLVSQFGVLTIPEFAPPRETPRDDNAAVSHSCERLLDKHEATVSIYVPIFSHSMFWINYDIPDPDPVSMFYFKFFINDRLVVSWGCCKRDGFRGKTMFALSEDKKKSGRLIRQTLTFGKDDKASPDDVLTVKVYRARGRRRMDTNSQSFVPTDHRNLDSNDRKKENDPVVLVQGGRLPRLRPFNHYQYALEDPIDKPYATFRYLPRSYPQLAALGVSEEYASFHDQLHSSTPSSSVASGSAVNETEGLNVKDNGSNAPDSLDVNELLDGGSSMDPFSSQIQVPTLQLPSPSTGNPPSPVKRSRSAIPQPSFYQHTNSALSTTHLPIAPKPRAKRNLTPSPIPDIVPQTTEPSSHHTPHAKPQSPTRPRSNAMSNSSTTIAASPTKGKGSLLQSPVVPPREASKPLPNFSYPGPYTKPRSKLPLLQSPTEGLSNLETSIPNPTFTKPDLQAPKANPVSAIPKKLNPTIRSSDPGTSRPLSTLSLTTRHRLQKQKDHANIRSVFDNLEEQSSPPGLNANSNHDSWVQVQNLSTATEPFTTNASGASRPSNLPILSRRDSILFADETPPSRLSSPWSDGWLDIGNPPAGKPPLGKAPLGKSKLGPHGNTNHVTFEETPCLGPHGDTDLNPLHDPDLNPLDTPSRRFSGRLGGYGGHGPGGHEPGGRESGGRESGFGGPESPLGKGMLAPPLKRKGAVSRARRERELEPRKYLPGGKGREGKGKGVRFSGVGGGEISPIRGQGEVYRELGKNVFR